jgi:hypothetical protein
MILNLQRGYVDVQWGNREFRMHGELCWGPGGTNTTFDLFRKQVRLTTGPVPTAEELEMAIAYAVGLLKERGIECVVH